MSAQESEISPLCEEGHHAECAHKFATTMSLFSRSGPRAVLCICDCHMLCPLTARSEVPERVWLAACTCPGSDGWRENQRQTEATLDVQRERQREVMQSIDLDRGKSGAEIERLILDAYAARGWKPPTDFAWLSRFIAAATARRGRGVRLAVESGRALRAARKWLRESRDQPDDGQDS